MRKIGIRLDPEMLAATRLLFEGAWDMNLPSGGSRINEVFYGDHARNTMDIFTPGKNNSPVVLFVHGGGFVAGDKAFNSHIGAFFARHGFLTAIMNYRLAPDSVWPCGAIDVASAVDWLAANAAKYGGDCDNLALIGQSAGSSHTAAAIFDDRFQPNSIGSVRACVLMSGLFDVNQSIANPGVIAYYGTNSVELANRSPVNRISYASTPTFFTVAELDPVFIASSVLKLASVFATINGSIPPLAWLAGHNHLSPAVSIGCAGDELGGAFIHALRTVMR